jgi:hypothetical protein
VDAHRLGAVIEAGVVDDVAIRGSKVADRNGYSAPTLLPDELARGVAILAEQAKEIVRWTPLEGEQ